MKLVYISFALAFAYVGWQIVWTGRLPPDQIVAYMACLGAAGAFLNLAREGQ